MIYDTTNETHDKYVQALKALDKEHMYSEYVKIPNTKEEHAFMDETNKIRFSSCFGFNISQARYNEIFRSNDEIA